MARGQSQVPNRLAVLPSLWGLYRGVDTHDTTGFVAHLQALACLVHGSPRSVCPVPRAVDSDQTPLAVQRPRSLRAAGWRFLQPRKRAKGEIPTRSGDHRPRGPPCQLLDIIPFAFKWLSAAHGTNRSCWSRPTTISRCDVDVFREACHGNIAELARCSEVQPIIPWGLGSRPPTHWLGSSCSPSPWKTASSTKMLLRYFERWRIRCAASWKRVNQR